MDSSHTDIAATSHLTTPEAEWEQDRAQERVIARLAEHAKVGVSTADVVTKELGMSGDRYTTSYTPPRGFRVVTDLLADFLARCAACPR